MKTEKLRAIVSFLLENQRPVTTKELSVSLNVSARSTSNYIKEINYDQDEKIIVSTKEGYILNRDQALYYLNAEENSMPSNYEERSMYIIKLLLIKQVKIDAFQLSDQLFVSYSTIKNDLSKMNKSFASFGLKIVSQDNVLAIQGHEKDKRRLASFIIFEESNERFLNMQRLKESFGEQEVTQLSQLIQSLVQKYQYYLNDFAYLNLLLHLLIIIRRIKDGHVVTNKENLIPKEDQALMTELYARLSELYQLNLSNDELYEIYLLFQTNTIRSLENSVNTLKQVVDPLLMKFTKDCIQSVNTHFFVDLMHETFVTPFALHLKNLLLRIKYNVEIKNPLVETIKLSTPSIYDIATYIGLKINQNFSTHLSEDEIGYLALHIGTEIERQKQSTYKVKAVLLCPNYMALRNELINQLTKNYNQSLILIGEASFEEDLLIHEYDLILSTVPVSDHFKTKTIQISPFLSTADRQLITEGLTSFETNRKNSLLRDNFDKYFSKNLFFISNSGRDKQDVLTKLTNSLQKHKYTNEEFQAHVFEREKASSTAFRKIAIPHSVKNEALKTGIAMVISNKGIQWSNNHVVHIVFLVAINQLDKEEFRQLYEALVNLFVENEVVEKARKCTNFQDFKNLIMTLLSY